MVSDRIKAARIQARYSPLLSSTRPGMAFQASVLSAVRHATGWLNPHRAGRRPVGTPRPGVRSSAAARRTDLVAPPRGWPENAQSDSGPAMATSWVLDCAAVMRSRFSTCFSTVRGDRCSRAAISLLEMPAATRRSTSACRSVMPSRDQRLGRGPSSSWRQRAASGSIPYRPNTPAAASSHGPGLPQPSASAGPAAYSRAMSAQTG